MATEEKGTNRLWHLLARKMAGEITPEEDNELSGLLQADPYALYTQEIIGQPWKDGHGDKALSEEDVRAMWEKHRRRLPKQGLAELSAKPTRLPRRALVLRYTVAAAACLLLAVAGWKWMAQPAVHQQENFKQLITENGSRSQLSLPDGSKVWLNAGSRLEYPDHFNGKSREVTLVGEAFFDVVKDTLRPFVVHTRTFQVRVVGTSFNVRAYEEEEIAETSLINGSVEVSFGQDVNKNNRVVLKPNEKLTIPTPAAYPQKAGNADKEPAGAGVVLQVNKASVTNMEDADNTIAETAWVYNKLAFKNTSFDKIAESLEKWFGVTIEFKNQDKKSLRLRGTFEGEGLDEILQAFQSTDRSSFQYSRDDNGTIWIE